ncbi:Guanosine-diphosphatase [Dimargaris cristalligena]|uniref:guanosine-diphosphatase n=1 Tax=Dimargaris cristalligena TaxID=215637 RepID=A0A4P9ZXE8_9FUNG|nr:Guanosine-diphosphatase [Dimargaris cristalligena]RKP37572.1 nucleoside phosphatase GDA1/CD39 [Dimargaris cristalligena]|eukprot:RKP37572.1 nucleoside phosphatase GDA1/CD39 [Dimargaris cristalligena]
MRETLLVQEPDSDSISVADSEGNNKYAAKPSSPLTAGRIYKYLFYGGLAVVALWLVLSQTSLRQQSSRVFTLFRPKDAALSSEHCDVSHPGRPLIQYALMIDAGSTGSRIHVYKFNYCKDGPELESEVFEHTKPGLSAYPDDPKGAARSLDALMLTALKNVPVSLHHCTPVTVKATAGLRLLGEAQSQVILDAVRQHLENQYPFPIIKKDGVVIMDGKDEGVYAWITVNYLLRLVGNPSKDSTAAVFDLGGGSTQIVFEPSSQSAAEKFTMHPGDHHYNLDFNGHHYDLYQHSYLGYGLKEARRQIKETILDDYLRDHPQEGLIGKTLVVPNPCFPSNYTEEWKPTNHPELKESVTFQGTDTGSWKTCLLLAGRILHKHAPCDTSPCSFQGIYQPPLIDYFATNPIYVFSYFYDRTQPLGLEETFQLKQLRALTKRACMYQHPPNTQLPATKQILPVFDTAIQSELFSRPHYCMDLNYVYSLLSTGYDIPEERTLHTARKINDVETGWCLGAAIAVLDDGQYCKVEEV